MSKPPSLPSYIFSNPLGQGTYATVYKAFRKQGMREVVAIKCISKKILNKKASDNLVKEIEILKSVKHENVVQLLDFTWDADYIYLILEYCPGGDLSRFIRERRCLPEAVVRHFLQQLAIALQVLNEKNIVHMDLKPQNILLSSSENPVLKLADFGFAQHMERSMDGSDLRGSPLYMAPEIFTRGAYSPKCDLWSVGVILFECLFGRAPFASATYAELREKILDSAPVEIPSAGSHLSEMCRSLLSGLLVRDPTARMSHREFFKHPFVDLDRAPNPQSLSKATSILERAVKADDKGLQRDAYALYTEGLTHLIAALHYERNGKSKESIRQKLYEYMTRAEKLQEGLTKRSVERQRSEEDRSASLKEMCKDCPVLLKGLKDLERFYVLIDQKKCDEALKVFESVFETTREALKVEPKGEKKKLYYKELEHAMSTAEDLKLYLRTVGDTNRLLRRRQVDEDERQHNEHTGKCSVM